jgi:hypothetical protein
MKLRRCVAGALLATTGGCMSFQSVPAERFIAAEQPSQVVVIEEDGTAYFVDHPRIVGDTLLGYEPDLLRDVAVPLARVVEVQVRRKNSARTLLMVGGIVTGAALVTVFAANATSGAGCGPTHPNQTTDCPPLDSPGRADNLLTRLR